MTTRIDVSEVVERQALGRFQFWIFGLTAAFLFFDGYDLQIIGFIAPALIRDWHMSCVALGPIFAAATTGFALGAMIFGMIADRWGRRRSTLLCLLSFGVFNLLTITAHSVASMMVWRFLAGLAMGGGMPNGYALLSEYFPRRMRATVIMLAALGFSVGSNAGGWSAAFLIPRYDWPSVFWFGGLLPLLLFLLLWPALPELMRFLVLKGRPQAEVAALMRSVAPSLPLPADADFVIAEDSERKAAIREIFADGRRIVTLLLWTATFMNLMVLQFIASWSPVLFTRAGLPMQRALALSAMFGIGGNIGVAGLGFLIDRWGADRVLGVGFIAVGVSLSLIGPSWGSFWAMFALLVVIGIFVPGGNAGTSAFAGRLYPTHVRSTGIGWNLGVGRSGQLLSPVLGTAMVAAGWSLASFYLAVAVPAFIAAAAISLTRRAQAGKLTAARAGARS